MSGAHRSDNRRRDSFISLIIPMVFVGISVYEEATGGDTSKWVVGALIIFGLAAAGNRFDGVIARVVEMHYGSRQNDEQPPSR